ncbi:hypothetical protein T492DRAFT_913433 [Pavlovales sp. CCMP2436]|nr:hypothetical protein T492DRAFT_913433 [Pavlovales sp. CCMP2436]
MDFGSSKRERIFARNRDRIFRRNTVGSDPLVPFSQQLTFPRRQAVRRAATRSTGSNLPYGRGEPGLEPYGLWLNGGQEPVGARADTLRALVLAYLSERSACASVVLSLEAWLRHAAKVEQTRGACPGATVVQLDRSISASQFGFLENHFGFQLHSKHPMVLGLLSPILRAANRRQQAKWSILSRG